MSETPIDTTRLRALLDERVAARATLTKAESALESATKTAITARGMLERTTTYMAYQTAWTDRLNAEVNLGHAVRRQSEQLTEATVRALLDEVERLRATLNTPELHDFTVGVVREAAHQRDRWGSEHDAGKAPADWFWLLGYLGGKALAASLAGNTEKALHHCISSAAALANWHAALSGQHTSMRPGIEAPEEGGDHG